MINEELRKEIRDLAEQAEKQGKITEYKGNNHFFVIIDGKKAIDFNYFGFLLSSNMNKATFPYNE